jgi:hypothetical protein
MMFIPNFKKISHLLSLIGMITVELGGYGRTDGLAGGSLTTRITKVLSECPLIRTNHCNIAMTASDFGSTHCRTGTYGLPAHARRRD